MFTPQVLNSLAAAEKRNLSVAVVLKKKKKKKVLSPPTNTNDDLSRACTHTNTHTCSCLGETHARRRHE